MPESVCHGFIAADEGIAVTDRKMSNMQGYGRFLFAHVRNF
jgi:hypothetical protein